MKHKEILKRAWSILWSYRVLWVFGIILGLTTASGSERTFNYTSDKPGRMSQPTPEFLGKIFQVGLEDAAKEFGMFFEDTVPQEWVQTVIIVGISLACLIVILIIASTILSYISRTALIQMVDTYEETDEKLSISELFLVST